tara:strand:- start:217 stop:1242 length:1026 start_codon:yes stop_codon:yes gene_type:complete
MNFHCSATKRIYDELICHTLTNGWHLYLDRGWKRIDNYFHKGISTSWCKIYIEPEIKIETNKLRDFPIFYDKENVSNFKVLPGSAPVDCVIKISNHVDISYQENFYPRITYERQTFKECQDLLYDALIENIGTFTSANNKKVLIPNQGGMDTLTVRSVFDFLGSPYELFDMPSSAPKRSTLNRNLIKNNWGFEQIQETDGAVIVTGFYGDEWILRNPYYVHCILSPRGIDICAEFDKSANCYMKEYFENYRAKCSSAVNFEVEELLKIICNDFQIWHLHDTTIFSPLKHISLLTLLSADTDTVLGQVTNAELSKSIIEKCNSKLLDRIDLVKNHNDPIYFT